MHHHEQSTHPRWPHTNTQESVGSSSGTNGGQRPASGTVDSFGMSSNYKGNKQNPANHSDNIPMGESCSVWMINLPPECTVNMLLSHIRQCDKVYATVINPPGGKHKTAAAKVVFWSQKGVYRLKKQVEAGAFTVGLYAPKFEVNRIRSRAARPGRECRVLQIKGHQHIINEQKLRDEVFRDKFQWQDDSVSVLASFADGEHILEWRFGSYRCQAENAYRAIQRKIGWGKGLVAQAIGSDALKGSDAWMWAHATVDYGVDPCA
ncbi:hypothetical protein PG993_005706 [Apiospora rasikravindrae]|uniref:RRM domain-containing protein n=1 Tax=Apiospora rasikravindrae TaxID=990691 RepID=A0ABR1T9J5_9PEZI